MILIPAARRALTNAGAHYPEIGKYKNSNMSIAAAGALLGLLSPVKKRLMGFPISPAHQSSAFSLGRQGSSSVTLDARRNGPQRLYGPRFQFGFTMREREL